MRVMVVEDDDGVRATLVEVLTEEGYPCVAAASGEDALALLELPPRPDAILLDLLLPKMDGRRFIERLRERPELGEIPIVIVSGRPDARQLLVGLEPLSILRKPLHLEDLIMHLERLKKP
jgi:CheY-like chemotaxis protein